MNLKVEKIKNEREFIIGKFFWTFFNELDISQFGRVLIFETSILIVLWNFNSLFEN